MKKGDIILIPFPFTDLTGKKLRPAIILVSTKSDVTVCFITSQFQWQNKYDINSIPSKKNGLKKPSLLRVSKFATVDKDLILGKIGELEKSNILALNTNLTEVLQLS